MGYQRRTSIETHFSNLGWSPELESVQILRSKIRNTADGGGVVYDPIIRRPLVMEDWTAMVMGHIARAWYCGWVPGIGHELSREMISPALIKKLREIDESSVVLSKICEEAGKTATQLNHRSAALRSDKVMGVHDREELREYGKKLMELDALVERLGQTHSPLQPFSHMSKVLMHNMRGNQLSDLGKESADSYRQIGDGVKILRDWVKHTLGLAKPVAIRNKTPLQEIPS